MKSLSFFVKLNFLCQDFTYIQPTCLCVKNCFNSLNPNNIKINYFLQAIVPLNFDCLVFKDSVSKFNILERNHFQLMEIGPHSSIWHWNEAFQVFCCFRLFELAFISEPKPRNFEISKIHFLESIKPIVQP